MALYESQDTASVSPSSMALAVQIKAERAVKCRFNRILDKTGRPWTVLKMRHAVSHPGSLVLITRLFFMSIVELVISMESSEMVHRIPYGNQICFLISSNRREIEMFSFQRLPYAGMKRN
jgi:hypothetical protein